MDNREELERLLKEFARLHAEYVLVPRPVMVAGDLGTDLTDLKIKVQEAETLRDEAWYQVISIFDREHDRVMALSRWLRDAVQMLSEVTASIDYRMREEK